MNQTAPPLPCVLGINLAGPGPWKLTGLDLESARHRVHREIITTHDGPITDAARQLLLDAYPGVKRWQARPAQVEPVPHRLTDSAALDTITALMSGQERDSDTTSAIADVIQATGRTIADCCEEEDDALRRGLEMATLANRLEGVERALELGETTFARQELGYARGMLANIIGVDE